MFARILVANRGEIACRVMRTARRLGVATVAVYSDADRDALHVGMADIAYRIGPPAARDSYLATAAILDAAKRSGAQAVHPGYGFLSENAEFAEACAGAELVFVGAPPDAIRAMGGKAQAKALMQGAGVPLVPGYHGSGQSSGALAEEARRIGFPVLVKASAGGGGKGMRVVEREADLDEAVAAAKREAAGAFGDDRVLLEKYLPQPRHVEVQIFADRHGTFVHLFDRDCSVQRRHQKVVEEAPAPRLDAALRQRMADAAIAAARAVGYVGVGTVEFLLDRDGAFYFMEMNTRLQVEHAVTEMITGQDLVEWQLRVAAGEPLPLQQAALACRGHAIEARLYAEDPARGFLPQTGQLQRLVFPEQDGAVRVDTGVRQGDAIPVHYDPMIAKLIAWGRDRDEAVRRLHASLEQLQIAGLTTNAPLLAAIVAHPAFLAAELDTRFIDRHADDLLHRPATPSPEAIAGAALGVVLDRAAAVRRAAARSSDPFSPWTQLAGWRLNDVASEKLVLLQAGDGAQQRFVVTVAYERDAYAVVVGDRSFTARATLAEDGRLDIDLDGVRRRLGFVRDGAALTLFGPGGTHDLALEEPGGEAVEVAGGGRLLAPMPGTVVQVLVTAGERVDSGQALVALEAMKMEHVIRAPYPGTVEAVCFALGEPVPEGAELVIVRADG